MLNELFAMERGLSATDAGVSSRHPDVKDMAKGGALRIRLGDGGVLSSIDIPAGGGRGALWTLRDGQQNGFPGLKTTAGLLDLDVNARTVHDSAWRGANSSEAKRAELMRLFAETKQRFNTESWPKPGHRRRITERLNELRFLADDPRTAAVPAIFERFLQALDGSPPLLVALADALMVRVRDGNETWLDPARAALTGAIALAFDVADDEGRFERDAGDPRQIEAVTTALARRDENPSADIAIGQCAFGGASAGLLEGNFPQPNLPGLGQTYLFARNRDIPAMNRYGRTGPASMPMSEDLAARLSGAILSLTHDDRQGKTWRLIPAESGDKQDLFIASLASDISMPLADIIGGVEESGGGWNAVETASASMLDHLLGHASSAKPQDDVRLLVLRTIDPANRKAVYDRRTSVGALHAAARRWHVAMGNVPDWIAFFVGTKKGMVQRRPPAMAPLSLIPLSRALFANGGRRRISVAGIPAGEALSLFLGDGDAERRNRRILRLVLQRHQALLVGLTQAKLRGDDSLKNFDPTTDLRRDALRSTAWIGALLHCFGLLKDKYMQNTAFKLGQLLAAADAVHVGYCADMRGGDTPPTLLGNAVFAIAGRNPVRALDILCGRWKPYGAWAQRTDQVVKRANDLKNKKEENRAMSIWRGLRHARIAASLCDDLKGALSATTKVDEIFRAELLLGYVAGAKPASGKAEGSDLATRNIEIMEETSKGDQT